jgi:hypothetical protein
MNTDKKTAKRQRFVSDIPANRVAYYEWKAVDLNGKEGALPAAGDVVCVSIPFHADLRAIAEFKDGKFLRIADGEVLTGVTFWCYAPATPEDMTLAAKENETLEGQLTLGT